MAGFSLRQEPYANERIANNFALVAKFINDKPSSIAILQEVAISDMPQLLYLGINITFNCYVTKNENFSNCIIYKTTDFEPIGTASSSDIPSLNKLKTENDPVIEQSERYLHIKLLQRGVGPKKIVDVVGVHLKWHSNPNDIIKAVNNYLATCRGNCIIAGDFNQNLNDATIKPNKASLVVYENGSIYSENQQRKKATVDALFYKLGQSRRNI